MQPFKYTRATDVAGATRAVSANKNARFLGGGTNLLDLMREGVESPSELVDIARLNLTQIRSVDGGVSIGALAKNTDTANHPLIRQNYPMLTQAILAGASPQIRNMATVGGNMMQRTRCPYFYNTDMPCNKRVPGSGCGALKGYNRMHAIFGASDKCIAVHPSDMCVALVALDETVIVSGPKGERRIPFQNFHRLPGETPQRDNTLEKNELIVAVEIPDNSFSKHVHYLKLRDRTSYAFALVSVAAALDISNNSINAVRLAMGGVAHKPWRLTEAETFLKGKAVTESNFQLAAYMAMRGAKGY